MIPVDDGVPREIYDAPTEPILDGVPMVVMEHQAPMHDHADVYEDADRCACGAVMIDVDMAKVRIARRSNGTIKIVKCEFCLRRS